jgi:hypothetical protein
MADENIENHEESLSLIEKEPEIASEVQPEQQEEAEQTSALSAPVVKEPRAKRIPSTKRSLTELPLVVLHVCLTFNASTLMFV